MVKTGFPLEIILGVSGVGAVGRETDSVVTKLVHGDGRG